MFVFGMMVGGVIGVVVMGILFCASDNRWR